MRHPQHRLAALFVLFSLASLAGDPAHAQVTPPRPGAELPPEGIYPEGLDPEFFTFKRALIQKVERLKQNRRDIRLGRLHPQSENEFRALTAVTGTVRVPVLLGLYSDTGSPPIAAAELQQELFDGPWETGTMQEYFREVSYGHLTLTGTVYDWVTTSNPNDYYIGERNGRGSDAHTGEYITEILSLNDPAIDFGQYDNDGPDGIPNSGDDDGYVDFIAVVHPKVAAECSPRAYPNNVWSHRSSLWRWPEGEYATNDPAAGGGVIRIDDYTIMPALSCDVVSVIEIGVFCHEFGHALGLPDLYDTSGSEGEDASGGIGYWGLMGYGGWNTPDRPAHMTAWSKVELGWLDPTVVTSDLYGWPIASSSSTPTAYKLQGPNMPDWEYFLVENRRAEGFDEHLIAEGVLIWHVDESRFGNFREEHKLLDLECWDQIGPDHTIDADRLDQGSRGNANNIYCGGKAFTPSTNASSVSYSGAATGVEIAVPSGCGAVPVLADLVVGGLPTETMAFQSAPHPFVEHTRLLYTLPRAGQVSLNVYSIAGRRIRQLMSGPQRPGQYSVFWDGRDDGGLQVGPGVYLCKIRTDEGDQTWRLLRVR